MVSKGTKKAIVVGGALGSVAGLIYACSDTDYTPEVLTHIQETTEFLEQKAQDIKARKCTLKEVEDSKTQYASGTVSQRHQIDCAGTEEDFALTYGRPPKGKKYSTTKVKRKSSSIFFDTKNRILNINAEGSVKDQGFSSITCYYREELEKDKTIKCLHHFGPGDPESTFYPKVEQFEEPLRKLAAAADKVMEAHQRSQTKGIAESKKSTLCDRFQSIGEDEFEYNPQRGDGRSHIARRFNECDNNEWGNLYKRVTSADVVDENGRLANVIFGKSVFIAPEKN